VTGERGHSISHASPPNGGFFFCLTCKAPADLDEPGDPFPHCIRGGHRHRTLEWRHFEEPARTPRPPQVAAVPIEAAPAANVRRLPSAERVSLTEMALQGYWQCGNCRQVTRLSATDCCRLCGSANVQRVPPALPEEVQA